VLVLGVGLVVGRVEGGIVVGLFTMLGSLRCVFFRDVGSSEYQGEVVVEHAT
jgi:hypothetical protein